MLSPGMRLGSYEVISAIGAGGMGEVYKGRDTRLDRTVALKVLPETQGGSDDRRLRFEREARAISSLSHPHICALYDIGEQDGAPFLVMEYIDGETLEERLRKGPLPLDAALRYAMQIADALDQAHRHGFVHRDLKPANIMLTRTGVKVLDFGLAKAFETQSSAAQGKSSFPTVSRTLTTRGSIVGTFQYMSPEQLEGAEADTRSDIFAFGAVLYEMLTGRRAFEGRTQASVIAAIMQTAPQPLSAAQPMAPPALEHVVNTCLAKDPELRWQTARDVLVQLKWIAESGSQAGAPRPLIAMRKRRELLAWAALGLMSLALGAVSWLHFSEAGVRPMPVRFSIPAPADTDFLETSGPTVSPDGSKIVFTTYSANGGGKLWLRTLDSPEPRELLAGSITLGHFWSPDSRFVAFTIRGKLLKLDVAGGPPVTLCASGGILGGTWNRDGVILIGASQTDPSLRRVSASGGELTVALKPDAAAHEVGLGWPVFLPDGEHFLYHARYSDTAQDVIRVGKLGSAESQPLMRSSLRASYAAPGYLLFPRQRTLFAQPFDARTLRLTGEPASLAEGVGMLAAPGGAVYSSSQNGVLAYRSGDAGLVQPTWYERSGRRIGSVLPAGPYRQMALSPDGKRAVVERIDPTANKWGIWLLDLGSGILSRLTPAAEGEDSDPVWSPDSRQVAFASTRNSQMDVYRQTIGAGQPELVWADNDRKVPEAWLKDGTILFTTATGKSYFRVSQDGRGQPARLLEVGFTTDEPTVSPDGRLVAFNSLESGRFEVYVATFPGFADKRQVSKDGGAQGRWRADSKELYFLTLDGKMMAVDVKAGPALETGPPRLLFQTAVRVNSFWDQFGVTADGAKFLVNDAVQEQPKPIGVIVNWPELLKK